MTKKPTKVPDTPASDKPEPREFGDDEPVEIEISRAEIATLFNAARALEMLRVAANEGGCGEVELVVFAVALDLTTPPAWEVVSDLQGRFRDAELRAAGHGEELDRLEARLKATAPTGGA